MTARPRSATVALVLAIAATVRIRDRLMGYELMGSTLVALVERRPGPDGIAQRAIDWYDIGALEIGRPTG